PGDVLTYLVTVNNNGNQAAVSSFLNDNLDPNVTLVVGSVQLSQGTVTQGNTAGDRDVAADFGDIAGGNSVTLSFDVTINRPLPAGVTEVTNQAVVFSTNAPPEPSDDPDTPDDDDETETPIDASPRIEASKTDLLSNDADGNGVASPGDTLTYVITILNAGNAAAAGLQFTDVPDANTTLVVGSVASTIGAVVRGNAPADSDVLVTIGTLAGGASLTVSFDVTINDPVTNNATQVFNQGLVSGNGLPDEPTDDPDTPVDDDPTGTPIDADPILELSKAVINTFDEDADGFISGGDRVDYLLTIQNVGNGTANNLRLTDTPDSNGMLINGSVQTSSGTVVAGNGAGELSVEVTIAALAAGGEVTIAYQVRVNDPLPLDVVSLINQALLTSDETDPVDSDDPDTPDNDDPTEVPLGGAGLAEIGLAKELAGVLLSTQGNGLPGGSALVTYRFRVENSGQVQLDDIQVADDLTLTFPAPASFEVRDIQSPTLSVNMAYNGAADTNMLLGTDSLAIGELGVIELSVLVFPRTTSPPYFNSATASGNGGGRDVTDVSQDGVDPDPDGNGPDDDSDPTVVVFDLNPLPVPVDSVWWLLLLGIALLGFGGMRLRREARAEPFNPLRH
ncbi:MAG: hypothetical protein AAF736_07185, partial [Pseudomonadota bacterium]